jgi:dolichol-phosphate mannosyltransferase
MSNNALDLSIIVPLYNEEDNVTPLAREILKVLGNRPEKIEVILVDDSSRDQTWTRIKGLCTADPRIRGLRHDRNRGQSAALLSGFQAARGSILCTLDGDRQNDPADFPRMLSELEGCDMVCGVRTQRRDTWVRRVSSRIARWARGAALGVNVKDSGCNLRVFRREILPLIPAFNGLHRFMPMLVMSGGGTVKEIPVVHHPRVAGVSKYGVWNRLGRGIADLIMIRLYMRRQLAPAKVEEA